MHLLEARVEPVLLTAPFAPRQAKPAPPRWTVSEILPHIKILDNDGGANGGAHG
jgi:hypothetical protein